MKHLVLGVIGHVDHGKTALVRALTGIDTDRLPEEKRRGISIALGFAHFTLADATVDLIDMPGHERFVRTMVAGASGIDAALLVVAANEGVMPQTREHVDIAGLLGLRRAIVAVSKADLVSPAQVAATEAAAAAIVREAGLDVVASLPVSALRGEGLDALRGRIGALAAARGEADGVAFLPVDRGFSVAGAGTVVTGTLRGGAVAVGDTLDLLPTGEAAARPVRVRALQVRGAAVTRAAPGQRVAVNLRDVTVAEAKQAAALAAPGTVRRSAWLTVALRSVPGAAPLVNGARLQALLGTTESAVRLRLLDRGTLEPGASCLAQLHAAEPVASPARSPVVLRLASPARTVAGGIVIEPEIVRRRRNHAAELERVAALARATPRELVLEAVRQAGTEGTSLALLSRLSALSPAAVAGALAGQPVVVRPALVVAEPALARAQALVASALPPEGGVSREQVQRALPAVGGAVLDQAVQALIASGQVREASGLLSRHRPQAEHERARAQAAAAAALSAELAEALRRGGLTPPDPASLAAGPASGLERKRALDLLLREGVIVRARDSGQRRDVLFHQEAILEAQRRLEPLLGRPPGLLVSDVGAALGISRKFSVPLLEHLDAIRFTRRVQDRRILTGAGR